MNIEIRKARSVDLEQILKINQASFLQPWPTKEFKRFSEQTFVAEKDKRVAGFIIVKNNNKAARIKLIAVAKSYQKQGIGKKLIEYILYHFKNNGIRTISVHIRKSNETGLSFLKSFSFWVVKTVKNYYTDKEDAHLLKKKLDG